MADCQLKIIATESIIPDVTNPVVSYSDGTKVYGDESIIYILCFKVHPEADLNGLFLKLIFTYSVKNTPKSEEFSFKIKPTRKWSDIENHFNPGAPAYNYFYGRQAYIKKVVSVFSDPKNTPHFFIYGQKRSGKSSVLYQIQKQLEERIPSAILVKVDFLSFELKSENDIFYHILKRILLNVETLNKKAQRDHSRDPLDPTCLVVPKKNEMDYDVLLSRLTVLKTIMQETRGWEESRLILFIDEFTIAYEGILEKLIPKDFMHRWKSLQAEGLFGAVLVGQDVLHSFIDETEGPNAFDILDKERLNYLEPEEASRLITETMEILSKRKDVFIGNAIERILYYSASSAHYTKWVCSRLVDYMNTRMLPKVTEADIDAAVSRSIKSSQPSTLRGLFDPLIFPGLKEKLSRFSWDQTTKILDLVADEEIRNPARGIRRIDLIAKSGETQEDIIKDLEERGVLENYHDYYKIKLKLYIVWYKERISLTTS
jgi:Archaeal ATPase.